MPTIVTNCSNNYGPYQFPEKLIPLFINNIRHRKPLPVYGKGENVRDWLYVVDHARAIDMRYAIDSRKLQKELGWEPSLQFEEGIEETVKWYLENQEWMDNVTSGDYQKYYDNMYSNR